ncbi:MAG: acyl-CoA dehydrogenase family protein, partial [Anaerolineaceae bacterium]
MDFNLSDEQRMWQNSIHAFVAKVIKPKARLTDETASLNWDSIHKMGTVGLLGLFVPEEYGGSNIDAVSTAIAMEELGWACGSTALTIAAHNGLGCASLALFGSHELKARYLPPAASGKNSDGSYSRLAALALTEPGAGSDLKGGITTRAELQNGQWRITGTKMWCTNASAADFIVTLVRTDPNKTSHSLSMILVPTNIEGLHVGTTEKKMGVKGSPTNEVIYQDVHVPANHLVGVLGEGLSQTLTILDGGRISIGAISVGLAQAALEEAIQYANQRKAFDQLLSAFQAIQWMLADAGTEIQAARLLIY